MKNTCYIGIFALLLSCSDSMKPLYGKWDVQSDYYKATYLIFEEHDSVKGKVLYYNDNTSIYREGEEQDFYVFKDLKKEDGHYVDAISGATNTAEKAISIQQKHQDTLEVITYIMRKPLLETWVRNNN